MKRIIGRVVATSILVCMSALMMACSKEEDIPTFDARIISVADVNAMVTPVEGEKELEVSDLFDISLKKYAKTERKLAVGDIITIRYDGTISDKYPATCNEIISIEYKSHTDIISENGVFIAKGTIDN